MPTVLNRPTTNPFRILLIEDDEVHSSLMQDELTPFYDLEIVTDSQSAQQRLNDAAESEYDLIILDHCLPIRAGERASIQEGLNLLKILERIHANGQTKRPVVMIVSAYVGEALSKQGAAAGVVRIFEKPFSLKEFRDFIDSLWFPHN